MMFKHLSIAEKSQHGTINLIETLWRDSYRSTAGYTGPDHFVLRLCGIEDSRKGCANIRYDMTVVP